MKNEEYLALHFKDIKGPLVLSRRNFLRLFGSGIIIFFSFKDSSAFQEVIRREGFLKISPPDLGAFLKIGEDGRITCFTGKIEMGQGVMTSFAQLVAEELEMPLDSVDMVMGDTDLCPWDLGTFGSISVRFMGPFLREAAGQTKAILTELAAEHLRISQDRLVSKGGVIFDKENNKTQVTYAQLAKGENLEKRTDKKASFKKAADFNIIGKPLKRLDGLEKVTGKAKYAGDISLPGMLYARILRPPAHGAKLKNADISQAKKLKGVLVVEENDFVAVLHEYPDEAEKALKKIKAEFDIPNSDIDDKNIFQHLLKVSPEGKVTGEVGDIAKGEKTASALFEETYLNSYVAHAPIEPHTALAAMEGNKITVWASTQTPFLVQRDVAKGLGFPTQNVRIITPFVGGGFGGKTENQQVIEAARLAKITGKPVQVAWTREEEFFFDAFRPAAIVKVKSGTTDSGKISHWDFNVYFAGERGSEQFYEISNHCARTYGSSGSASPGKGIPGSHPFNTGPWRAPGSNTSTFARESQIDIMAFKSGKDPVEFRLNNLTNKKMINALKSAAEKFGWQPSKAPSKRGFGVACSLDADTYVVTMAEVKVDKNTGNVRVERIVCVQDMGLAVNPEGARMQIEGCVTMGLGYALSEEIYFRNGKIFNINFDTYKIPHFSWLPRIETFLIESGDPLPHGGGEPAITGMGAVIANAIFDATGARLFQLPMTPERVKEAVKKI